MKSPRCMACLAVTVAFLLGAGEVKLVPVGADGAHTIDASLNQITLFGPDQIVTFEIRIRGWDPDQDGSPLVSVWQVTVDPAGFLGASSTVPNVIDLIPLGFNGESQLGAYQVTDVCFDLNNGPLANAPCGHPSEGPFVTDAECQQAGGLFCIPNSDFLLSCCDPLASVSREGGFCAHPIDCPYSWGAASLILKGAADNGSFRYCGTLRLHIPTGATGTYTVELYDHDSKTFISAPNSATIPIGNLIPATISVLCGADGDCDDGLACTINSCNTLTGECELTVDDGSCFLDDACFSPSDINPNNECQICKPDVSQTAWSAVADGTICVDEGNECTNDLCESGYCSHPGVAQGTPCGDQSASECDEPDACDGLGTCLPNAVEDGTKCTPDENECTNDICYRGECGNFNFDHGTPCGNQDSTDCDGPDLCNGFGECISNLLQDGEPCTDDGNACTLDVCLEGVCEHPNGPPGRPCSVDGIDECTDPFSCDDSGNCVPIPVVDGAPCTDDGLDCTDDVCGAGVCTHPAKPAGTSCGNAEPEGNCDRPDTCDGAGTCLPNFWTDSTLCRSAASECDYAEYCTGESPYCPEDLTAPDNSVCLDDGNVCTLDLCIEGDCHHPNAAACRWSGIGEIRFVPVGASGDHTFDTARNQINLFESNQTVTMEIRAGGWGFRALRTCQVTLDPLGLKGENSTIPNPIDLVPTGYPDERQLGAYQIKKTCFDPKGGPLHSAPCGSPSQGPFITELECQQAGGLFCLENPEFMFACCNPLGLVSRGADFCTQVDSGGCRITWGAYNDADSGVNLPWYQYLGTLELTVSPGALGVYSVGGHNLLIDTYLVDEFGATWQLQKITPALINIACRTDAECPVEHQCMNSTCIHVGKKSLRR